MAPQPKKTARVVAITGVSRGLGRALAERWAREGWGVAGCARSEPEIETLRGRWESAGSCFDVVDVTSDEQVRDWIGRVIETRGVPDLVINNAALINRSAPLWELSAAEFDAVMDVNLKGVANVMRHVLPHFVQRNRGIVVNLSSGWGRSVDADVAPYCATKWAIEGLSKAVALEVPDGVAVIPLNPGIIDTAMLRSCFGGAAQSYPHPDDWAKRAAPFIEQLGAAHNGQSLSVP